jgi:RecB family exonuclease
VNARLVDFICTALQYAERSTDAGAQRLLDSPFSGVSRADARAFAAAATGRERLSEAIAGRRVALGAAEGQAVEQFARALDRISALASLPAETASTLVETIAAAFDLRGRLRPAELRALDAIAAEAAACDAESQGCSPAALAHRLRAHLRPGPAATAELDVRPLAPADPEPPRAVRRRVKHFSASSLEMYVDCSRKWFYRYTCATVDDPGSPASFYGTAFHAALEDFHGEVRRVDETADAVALERRLIAWVNASFEKFSVQFGSAVEYELQRRRACRTAKRYITWLIERSRKEPFTVAGTEVAVNLELDGLTFVGFIDRLDRDERSGAVNVLDYKTGKIAEYASLYRDEIARFVEFQLPFYYWSQAEQGERVFKLALIPLRDGYGEIAPVELEVVPVKTPLNLRDRSASGVIGIDELERARAKMIEIARSLSEERISRFGVAADAQSCEYCVYRHACRSRPVPEAPRFSR